jgi:hypothetical protein
MSRNFSSAAAVVSPAASLRRLVGVSDDAELLDYVRSKVADEYGLSEAQGRRLRGATVRELRADAAEMRSELGLEPLDEGAQRDERGRFATGAGSDMNRAIRQAAGR